MASNGDAYGAFNEAVLLGQDVDARMQFVFDGVRKAFPRPVSDGGGLRRCMGEAMRIVVFGSDQTPAHLAEDVQVLIRYVQSPGRRLLFGWSKATRRKRFYDALRQLWTESSASGVPRLVTTAKGVTFNARHEEEIVQQVPLWMFTFTGSGADLLARTIGILASRDDLYDRVLAEALADGASDTASAVVSMEYLKACLLETCRLFPPVTRTFHVAPHGDIFNGTHIPDGMDILHCFTASQRDTSAHATANDFRPEQWMEPGGNADVIYPSLFLGGARNCSGKDPILFVCKVAISTLMRYGRIRPYGSALSEDPVPHAFPASGLRFSTGLG